MKDDVDDLSLPEDRYLEFLDDDTYADYVGQPKKLKSGPQHRPTGSMSANAQRIEMNQFYSGIQKKRKKKENGQSSTSL